MSKVYDEYLEYFFNPILNLFIKNETRLLLMGHDLEALPKDPSILNIIDFIDIPTSYIIKDKEVVENAMVKNKSRMSTSRIAAPLVPKYPVFISKSDTFIIIRNVNNNLKDIYSRLVDISTVNFNEMIGLY